MSGNILRVMRAAEKISQQMVPKGAKNAKDERSGNSRTAKVDQGDRCVERTSAVLELLAGEKTMAGFACRKNAQGESVRFRITLAAVPRDW